MIRMRDLLISDSNWLSASQDRSSHKINARNAKEVEHSVLTKASLVAVLQRPCRVCRSLLLCRQVTLFGPYSVPSFFHLKQTAWRISIERNSNLLQETTRWGFRWQFKGSGNWEDVRLTSQTMRTFVPAGTGLWMSAVYSEEHHFALTLERSW